MESMVEIGWENSKEGGCESYNKIEGECMYVELVCTHYWRVVLGSYILLVRDQHQQDYPSYPQTSLEHRHCAELGERPIKSLHCGNPWLRTRTHWLKGILCSRRTSKEVGAGGGR